MCGDYYIGGRRFASLSDLIGYYSHVSCLLKGEKLLFPVAPPEVRSNIFIVTFFKSQSVFTENFQWENSLLHIADISESSNDVSEQECDSHLVM